MSEKKDIDESLRVCEEIQKRFSRPDTPEQESVPQIPVNALNLESADKQGKKKQKKRKSNDRDWSDAEYQESHPFLRTLLGVLICALLALVLSLVITEYVAHHTSVEGSSMESTLSNGDQLIVENISYYFHEPERFDVITFPYDNNVSYIKRIIGLPGETVQIMDGTIFINGEILQENYGNADMEDDGLAADIIHLGEDEYFVLGDNRNASIDSRKPEVGNVKRENISGKAWVRFYPFDKMQVIQ